MAFRELQPNEIIQVNDQWFCRHTNRWNPVGHNCGYAGTTVFCSTLRWRRADTERQTWWLRASALAARQDGE